MATGEHTNGSGAPDDAAASCGRPPSCSRRSSRDRGLLGVALDRGADAPAHGGRRRLQPRRRAAPPLHEGAAQAGAGREHRARRVRARRHRHPRAAREARVHDPERLPAERASSRRPATTRATRETIEPQHCYVCKQHYRELHHFYDQLCPPCADVQLRASAPRPPTSRGRVALLTGGRVKIGYQAGIKLLRAGAHLIVTTRFPRDSAARYAQEPDFEDWGDRLEIYGLDLRHTPSVEAFCRHLLATHDRLDFIVNNACQTVRRPPDFYRHMLERERAAEPTLPDDVRGCSARTRAAPLRHARGRRSAVLDGDRACRRLGSTLVGRALAGPLAARRSSPRRAPLPRGAARPGPAAGRPPRPQLVAAPARRGLDRRAARDAARQRGRAVRAQRAAEAADAAHARAATSTSSTCRRWRGSSTGASRRPGTRTRTWRRRR